VLDVETEVKREPRTSGPSQRGTIWNRFVADKLVFDDGPILSVDF